MKEKEEIERIIGEHPRHSVKMIIKRPELWAWVLEHCDPNCIENVARVYTSLHPDEKILCPCGSNKHRKVNSLQLGLRFCGPAKICSAARNSVSKKCIKAAEFWDKPGAKQKRLATTMSRYKVQNVGQLPFSRKRHTETYNNLSRVEEITSKIKKTFIERYGVENAQQIPDIREKNRQTCLDRYGVPNPNQKHMPAETINILNNVALLRTEFEKKSPNQICHDLGICRRTLIQYHNSHKLDFMSPFKSGYEKEIDSWLTSMGIEHTKNVRYLCKGKEVDIYIPEHKLAVEFDGLYWHGEMGSGGKCDKWYHLKKTKECLDKGVELIHIFEDEWLEKQDICKSIISQKLGISTTKIMGRKCSAIEITNKEAKDFLSKNHLQGWAPASRSYALQYDNDIVAIMTFGKPRFNKKYEFELVRLAIKCNFQILGGIDKLWKFSIQRLSPKSVVSYCDKRWFTGDVYRRLGFALEASGGPTYWYIEKTKRVHRVKYQKHKLIKMGCDSNLTEQEIVMDLMNIDRIWDCGQDTWSWNS